MRQRIIILFFLLLCSAPAVFAQGDLSALFNYNAFYDNTKDKPYVETYISFDAWTLQFMPTAEGSYRATVEVVLSVTVSDSVVYIKKYDLNSPTIADTNNVDFNFLDVQRFYLSNGLYSLNLSVRDKNSNAPASQISQRISLSFDDKQVLLTKPQIMATVAKTVTPNILSRNGYDMEPYLSDFVPQEISRLNVYSEVYNINREVGDDAFLSNTFVEERSTGRRMGIQHTSRHQSAAVVPIFTTLDVSQLPSGNYNLVVELRNRANDLMLYHRLPFYRSNPVINLADSLTPAAGTFAGAYSNEKELNVLLDALYAIASDGEKQAVKQMVRKDGQLDAKQSFLYHFWYDRYGMQAEQEWRQYKERINYCNEHFGYLHVPGYRTDRGRVYLQYGAPDFVRDEKNFVSALKLGSGTDADRRRVTDAAGNVTTTPINPPGGHSIPSLGHIYYLPYQLWRYNKLDRDDANRVFLFWDEFRSGNYHLLVSNARGEVWDPLWERRLSQQQLEEYVEGEVGEQFRRGH